MEYPRLWGNREQKGGAVKDSVLVRVNGDGQTDGQNRLPKSSITSLIAFFRGAKKSTKANLYECLWWCLCIVMLILFCGGEFTVGLNSQEATGT